MVRDMGLWQNLLPKLSIKNIFILVAVVAITGCMSSESVKSRLNLKADNSYKSENINLLPKYGLHPKTPAQKRADDKFLKTMDDSFNGDREKAAEAGASIGWKYLRKGEPKTAIRRFNQAWMLDQSNGSAIWGMAAYMGSKGKYVQSFELFEEAKKYMVDDVNFLVDYARTVGFAGIELKNDRYIQRALSSFETLYEREPRHTLNIQNWAIVLYYMGNYSEAWKKIELAEKTPRNKEIDQNFVKKLEMKMSRP